MSVPDVLSRQDFSDTERDIPVESASGPELWPIGAIDVLLVVLGLLVARLLTAIV